MSVPTENPGKNERILARGCWFRASSPRLRTRSRSTESWAFLRVVSSESGLTLFSTTSFSATSNIREARVSEPWFSCSTAAATISWKRFPTSSWSFGKGDDAADGLRGGGARGRERLLDRLGREGQGPRRDRTPEGPDHLSGRHVHAGGAEAFERLSELAVRAGRDGGHGEDLGDERLPR